VFGSNPEQADHGRAKNDHKMIKRQNLAVLVFAAFCLQATVAKAASDEDIATLTQAIKKLQIENQNLAKRLNALEAERVRRNQPASPTEHPVAVPRQKAEPATTHGTPPASAPSANQNLEQRVKNLETTKTAQEDAVRTIIRDSLAKTGPKINEFVSLGGAIEVTGGRTSDFSGEKTDSIQLSTAELDFDIAVSEWAKGSLIIQYNAGGNNPLFPSTPSFNANPDSFIVDRAAVTVGDVQRFPLYAKFGRDVLPFGTSTGVHRNDVLSIENPLTIEVFETRRTSVGIGFALPTPAPGPTPPGVVIPPVRPLVLAPSVEALARGLGYRPLPILPKAPTPTPYTQPPPPFYGSLNVYDANTVTGINRRFGSAFSARLGYQTTGHCGRPFDELKDSWVCPWGLDVSVDYISSVFDSLFLESEYSSFMTQFGRIPGMSADVKLNFGPFLLIAEYNTALQDARFVDSSGRNVSIAPAAWQVALGYQFGWNPWVETIGAQGTFLAVGYSRSYDLAGVIQETTAGPMRVGFVPESRLTITAGEWVLEGLKIAIEYSHNWDYSTAKGGTGRQADGIFLGFSYIW
jgi:hypothetical protein